MIALEAEIPEVTLQPGELHLAQSTMVLQTILGSCVGITFWCKRIGAGAMCHGVLPRRPAAAREDAPESGNRRYVDYCIRYLARKFDELGARRGEVEVKVFGGSDVLPILGLQRDRPTVGALNAQTAMEVLAAEGFEILAYDLGGNRGRKIQFHTGTGTVDVFRIDAWGVRYEAVS